MKIKHEIEILSDDPFATCRLDREQYANVLTQIITNYADGFVLAINNEWGTGKTTFMKMWRQSLINDGFHTIYFNAWENDFNSNPLVALISELKPLTKGQVDTEMVFKSVIEKGAVLTKNVGPALLKSLLKKYVIDTDLIVDAVENSAKAATEILEEEIKEFSAKKKTIAQFREELERFIKKTQTTKPLVFVIDELDRCRPNYAVEVLEQLKHLFSVNGIVFVLSIDKSHLASSVKGYYGTDSINADDYLRRFIDLEYSLPRPSTTLFSKYLYDYYELDLFFRSAERRQIEELHSDGEYLLKVAELLLNKHTITLRQQEKIFGQTGLILHSFRSNQYTFSALLFVLIYFKVLHGDIYQKIQRQAFTLQQLGDAVSAIILVPDKHTYGFNMIYVVALLLYMYNNNQDIQSRVELLQKNKENELITQITLEADVNHELVRSLSNIDRRHNNREINLNYLIKKIDLTEALIIN